MRSPSLTSVFVNMHHILPAQGQQMQLAAAEAVSVSAKRARRQHVYARQHTLMLRRSACMNASGFTACDGFSTAAAADSGMPPGLDKPGTCPAACHTHAALHANMVCLLGHVYFMCVCCQYIGRMCDQCELVRIDPLGPTHLR